MVCRPTGSYPQTGFWEIEAQAAVRKPHVLQADFWPGKQTNTASARDCYISDAHVNL
jgi:hypothetical protein